MIRAPACLSTLAYMLHSEGQEGRAVLFWLGWTLLAWGLLGLLASLYDGRA